MIQHWLEIKKTKKNDGALNLMIGPLSLKMKTFNNLSNYVFGDPHENCQDVSNEIGYGLKAQTAAPSVILQQEWT